MTKAPATKGLRGATVRALTRVNPRFLPFADAASETLPLSRLLRLSMFQITVGMALVLIMGTLNRVMIVELSLPATIVGVMIALPIVFAPARALIGFRSDNYQSALGWRRVPFIWKGSLLQFGGFAVMPFALLVLAGKGEAHDVHPFIGQAAAATSFLLVGAGVHMVQTVGLALATDLTPEEDQPKVVGLMYVMLLVGMAVSAVIFGALLADFSPGRLVQVVQGAAVLTLVLNTIAMWKMEPRNRRRTISDNPLQPDFGEAWRTFVNQGKARMRLTVIALGTMGFGMADVLLEPFGGQVLDLSVGATTRLTATFAIGGLFGLYLASRVLSGRTEPLLLAGFGALMGLPAFALVILSSTNGSVVMFVLGTLLIGFGAGIFGHATLTSTMRLAPREQVGLALGAWGAVQATAAGIAISLGGVLRDVVLALPVGNMFGAGTPYVAVYAIEVMMLALVILVLIPLVNRGRRTAHG